MDFSNNRDRAPRQMFDVSAMGLTCASCSTAINQLPFEPQSKRPLYCHACNKTRNGGAAGSDRPRAPREMVDVASMGLTCAECGVAVTSLPFMPSGEKPVYCPTHVPRRPRM